MPTIRKRSGRWQALVRLSNKPPVTKSFDRYQDAVAWAAQTEKQLRRTSATSGGINPNQVTLADLIERYRAEISPAKRSAEVEVLRLGKMMRDPVASLPLVAITSTKVANYRDRRMEEVSVDTVRRDLGTLQHVWEVAETSWGLVGVQNPFKIVRRPAPAAGRQRRLSPEEEARVLQACAGCRNPFIPMLFEFALQTGMRMGEMVAIRRADIDADRKLVFLAQTKNGRSRMVPLSQRSLEVLEQAGRLSSEDLVFPLSTSAVKQAWRRVVKRAGLADLHFHDLRHEAISRMFERGLSMPEVALVSGHRTPAMLMRYSHAEVSRVAKKL